MKNAEVLRMAEALLTPSVSTTLSSPSEGGESETPEKGDDTIGQISLVTFPSAANTATGMASSSAVLVTVALEDPALQERLRVLLESTVRMLYPKGLLAGKELPRPIYPLVMSGDFPLPDSLAAPAAYHTAWLLTGESRLATAYNRAMEIYYSSLEAAIAPIVRKH